MASPQARALSPGHPCGAGAESWRKDKPVNLFQLGDFKLHSGLVARWKIDCDALTDEDMDAIALMIAERVPARFGDVHGIPRGGVRLAERLRRYESPEATPILIVDDVLTTGASMSKARDRLNDEGHDVFGAVIFARGLCPSWIKPLFSMPR